MLHLLRDKLAHAVGSSNRFHEYHLMPEPIPKRSPSCHERLIRLDFLWLPFV